MESGEIGDVGGRARKKAQKNRPGRVGSFGGSQAKIRGANQSGSLSKIHSKSVLEFPSTTFLYLALRALLRVGVRHHQSLSVL